VCVFASLANPSTPNNRAGRGNGARNGRIGEGA
jgi:hypothetical protein